MRMRTVTVPGGEPLRLYLLADAHLGDRECAERELEAWLARLRDDPGGRLLIVGDLLGAIGKGDRRLSLPELADWVLESHPRYGEDILAVEAARVVELLEPVASQIDGWVSGNHEQKPRAWYGRDVTLEMARRLGVEEAYLGALGWVRYSFRLTRTGRVRYDVLLHHGRVAGRRDGVLATQLEEMLSDYDVDLAVTGHSHALLTIVKPRVEITSHGAARLRDRRGIAAGTWQRTPGGGDAWADECRLRPRQVGGAVVQFEPRTCAVEVIG